MKNVNKVAKKLAQKGLTLALAESCTGGFISNSITDIPGASKFFKGGITAYSNDVKTSFLGVSKGLIKEYGAVSREVAISMAKGAKRVLRSDIAVSITGIAGPSGGTKKKPIGLAYIAFSSSKKELSRKVLLKKSDRKNLKKRFAQAVFQMISENI